jgi:hypothetical protein
MYDTGDNVLALSYRVVYTVLGYYVTARLAPYLPLRHMWILAGIGSVVGIAGAVSTIPMKLGPAWYPIAIAATALPCAWFARRSIARARRTEKGSRHAEDHPIPLVRRQGGGSHQLLCRHLPELRGS